MRAFVVLMRSNQKPDIEIEVASSRRICARRGILHQAEPVMPVVSAYSGSP